MVISYETMVLEGVRYVVVRESVFRELCEYSGVIMSPGRPGSDGQDSAVREMMALDGRVLARRLTDRRRRVGLTQVELAKRAGVRAETINRMERGKTTPDFSTIRKLVVAIKAVEDEYTQTKGAESCQSS